MAGTGLRLPGLDPAARRVLDAYLAELAGGLVGPEPARAAIVAELGDGLTEAVAAGQARGLTPAAAAAAAVAKFGEPRTLAAGFAPELAAVTGRRVGLGLLATGPLVGLTWLAALLASSVAVGRQPPAGLAVAAAVFGMVLAVAVPAAVLSVAVTGRLSRWLPVGPRVAPTAAGVAAALCVGGDVILLAGLLAWAVVAGGLTWAPAVAAAAVSSARLALAGRALRRCLAARGALA
jgi:hypothetical protein